MLEHYLPHLGEIERRLAELRPHALVIGLGPSARLLPLIDKKLLEGVRLWGVNDCFAFIPVHDLVVMDGPHTELHPETDRYRTIMASTPERFWFYQTAWIGKKPAWGWSEHLPATVRDRVNVFDLKLLNQHVHNGSMDRPLLTDATPNHLWMTPTGTTCMAWREGARRIGIIGVDLIPGQRPICSRWDAGRWFFKHVARQAIELGGVIQQLSPFAKAQWNHEKEVPCPTASESSSDPTCGKPEPEPS